MYTSSLFLGLRSRSLATLTGLAIAGLGSSVGAQVVEDKNPTPPAKVVADDDKVKDAADGATDAAKTSAAAAKSSAEQAKTANPADGAELNAAQKAANTTGTTVYDKGSQGSAAEAKRAADNVVPSTKQTENTVNRSAESVKNPTDTNAATQPSGTQSSTTQPAATQPTTQQSTVQQRINAGVQTGANAVNAAADGAAAANAAGVGTGQIAAQLGLNFAANAANRLTLSTIQRNSVFAGAGFQPGDQFVSVGGTPIGSQAALYRYLGTVPVGQRVPIIVMRNGQQQTIYWTPDQRFVQMQPTFRSYVAAAQPAYQPAAGGNMLGINLDRSVTDAVVVASVAEGSPAANAGVRQGDQIVAVNDDEVHSATQFDQAVAQLAPNSPARIAVARTVELQISPVQQTGAVAPTGPAVVQPAVPGGVVDPRPVGPVRRFRFR